jgi:hypothetical protein
MKHVATGIAAAVALGLVTFTPDTASAKPRTGVDIWGPNVGIHIGPQDRYRDYDWRERRAWRHSYRDGPRFRSGPRYGYYGDRRERRYYR